VVRRSRVIFRGWSSAFAQFAVHPNKECGMGSGFVFLIAFFAETIFARRAETAVLSYAVARMYHDR
jgi:hypothetical protein